MSIMMKVLSNPEIAKIAQFPGKDNESIRLIKIAILYG